MGRQDYHTSKLTTALQDSQTKLRDQAFELKIQRSLERVRKKTLAMKRAEDLANVAHTLFREFSKLGDTPDQITIGIINEKEKVIEFWITETGTGKQINHRVKVPIQEPYVISKLYRGWKQKKKTLIVRLQGSQLRKYFNYTNKLSGNVQKRVPTTNERFVHAAYFSHGLLDVSTLDARPQRMMEVLERFAEEFNLTYARFLDLQKAEAQTREAQIEASLEKVRAAATAMRKPADMVNVCKIISRQLNILGVSNIRNVQTAEYNLKSSTYKGYEYYPTINKSSITEQPFTGHPLIKDWVRAITKSSDSHFQATIKGRELEKWRDYLKKLGQDLEPGTLQAESLSYYFYSIRGGAVGISTYVPLSDDEIHLFRSFSNVFNLAYRRYLDVRQVEVQAREVQIELALERVRARTMAMHSGDELAATTAVLFQQFEELGVTQERLNIGIIHEQEGVVEFWSTEQGGKPIEGSRKVPLDEPTSIAKAYKGWKRGKKSLVIELSGRELKQWIKYLKNKSGLPFRDELVRERRIHKVAYFSQGMILASGMEPASEETVDLLNRFAAVFEQTYTRFLDLQKAEKQAREAEIQLALERVRAKTMAMHQSDELREVVAVLLEQIRSCGFEAFMSMMILYDRESRSYDLFMSSDVQSVLPEIYHVPYFNNAFHRKFLASLEESEPYRVFYFGGETKREYDKISFSVTDFAKIPEKTKNMMRSVKECYLNCAYMKYGCIESLGLNPLPDDKAIILQRFAKVFEQTYTRFLDLQKAEKQAREAEIQLALERVRAKTLAMQSSEDLADASFLLANQVRGLGIKTWGCAFHIYADNEEGDYEWFSTEDGILPFYKTPRKKVFKRYFDNKKRGGLYIEEFKGKVCQEHYRYLSTLPVVGDALLDMKRAGIAWPTSQIDHVVYFSHGYLLFITYEPVPDAYEIFKRFAKEFEQTYVRFLDLKRAEERAREAQIEAALERVRSKTMAMHSSNDASATVVTLFNELKGLGVDYVDRFGIGIVQPDHILEAWTVSTNKKGKTELLKIDMDMTQHPLLKAVYKEPQREVFRYILRGRDKENYFRVINKVPNYFRRDISKLPPEVMMTSFGFKEGFLYVFSSKELAPELSNVFRRFTAVFAQTYRRYLDLQNAEAQAREAQIEAALERIRSRSMAMHRSDELQEVVNIVIENLRQLNISCETVTIAIPGDDSSVVGWSQDIDENYSSKVIFPAATETVIGRDLYKAWQNNESLLVRIYNKKQKNEHLRKWFAIPAVKRQVPPGRLNYLLGKESYSIAFSFNRHASMAWVRYTNVLYEKSETDVLQRFSNVFEQVYTRFLDLTKAEAQAREAQIEASLERVRSRTAAMHNSDELMEVADLLFNELRELGGNIWGSGFGLCEEGRDYAEHWMGVAAGKLTPNKVPIKLDRIHKGMYDAWRKRRPPYSVVIKGSELKKHYRKMMALSGLNAAIGKMKKSASALPKWQKNHVVPFKYGYLLVATLEPYSEESILPRFAKVFEQTYSRFLDLQRAEAQAREAQIEAALERVRSRSMAMHESNELLDVIKVVSDQLKQLGFRFHNVSFGQYDQQDKYRYWMSSADRDMPFYFEAPVVRNPMMDMIIDAWKRGDDFMAGVLTAKQSSRWHRHVMNYDTPYKLSKAAMKNIMTRGYARSVAIMPNIFLAIGNYASVPYTDAENAILKRMASVFDQSYIRFLDLQKAEAQARESQIEASLEKVRSSAMAMHSSADISQTTTLVFEELKNLGIRSVRCGIGLLYDNSYDVNAYAAVTSSDGSLATLRLDIRMSDHPVMMEQYKCWKNQKILVQELKGATLSSYYKLPFFHSSPNYKPPRDRGQKQWGYYIPFNEGLFYSWNDKEYTESELAILKRFKTNIALTFRRFLDLQKAEAQARESQIEVALERVRSRSMAMHKSEELLDVINVVSDQLSQLGIFFDTVSFARNSVEDDYDFWFKTRALANPVYLHLPWIDSPVLSSVREAQNNNQKFFADELPVAQSRAWHKHLLKHFPFAVPAELHDYVLNRSFTRSVVIMPSIMLIMSNYSSRIYNDNENEILKRFAGVFEQSYTRFLDLKKAEERAEESKIEAAIEKVRSRSLAMHKSSELREVIQVVFERMRELEVRMDTASIVIMVGPKVFDFWVGTDDNRYQSAMRLPMDKFMGTKHPGNDLIRVSRERPEYFTKLYALKEKNQWWEYAFKHTDFAQIPQERKDFLLGLKQMLVSVSTGKNVMIQMINFSDSSQSARDIGIHKRFTKVFDQAYTRFLDLKKAEEQAMEARKQASLERVRGEVASMRSKEDLEKITPLIWKELTTLGVAFIRCGVFIFDGNSEKYHVFLATPDGEAITSFVLPFPTQGKQRKILEGWRNQTTYVERWTPRDFRDFGQVLVNTGFFKTVAEYTDSIPKGGFTLHCIPFQQGMLYVGNTNQLEEDDIGLIQRLVTVFATAFARYEDFSRLENAKAQIEKTLTDLRQAQQLLVQSEKMASLGELTAGIAHEIQNPLNFVNNFSEVSTELVEEMLSELATGNWQPATEIAADIKQNLEKILHHGKRADGIVKGMLQHSRGASGQKEQVDINALCDEYLRLAFHGYRAKDKSFNAKFETDFDPTLPKLNVIPQDIGRVVLNLINNAFYACTERARSARVETHNHASPQQITNNEQRTTNNDYSPLVTVTTKNLGNKIEIHVKDNGNGIPESMKEKIFQPFFTTKPTGQGTGLGLSLSYDIIKAHGGALNVESEPGKGTVFTIRL